MQIINHQSSFINDRYKVSVIGLGNELRGDDGIGVHAIRMLQGMLPSEVPCQEIGSAVLQAQDLLEASQTVIVIDAVRAGSTPGTILLMDVADARLNHSDSLHDLSIPGLLRLIPQERRPRALVVGIEPQTTDYALTLSNPVAYALPKIQYIVTQMVDLLSRHQVSLEALHEAITAELP